MNQIQVLDCTLRDGGYCNQWNFGLENEKKITEKLKLAGIDIIECGFLTNQISYREGTSKFTDLGQISHIIPEEHGRITYVVMMNYGEYRISDLPRYDGSSVDGIRVAFHKKDAVQALDLCEKIKAKGYRVFIQGMVSLSYTDEEFLSLIRRVNEFEPYAFYIVDSFGMMKRKDLIRLFYIVEHNLKENIWIGFHSHNNMQLAYSNAQTLVDTQTNRRLIIDSSVFGMGRGAGNLNTELFVEYLNDNAGGKYVLKPLLQVIDEVLSNFYHDNYWGYSLPNYLSAVYDTHPNYAGYLAEKNTLTVENIDEIFSVMLEEKRAEFDKHYIEDLYIHYMEKGETQESHLAELDLKLRGKAVLLIAPGKSSEEEKEKVNACADRPDVVSISVNFAYPYFETDYIFLSNLRRFRDLDKAMRKKTIITSNIPAQDVYLRTQYSNLLNPIESVRDNAGLMLIQYLIQMGVSKVILAGVDGYSHDADENYAERRMQLITKKSVLDSMNTGISKMLSHYSHKIAITYLTKRKFVGLNIPME